MNHRVLVCLVLLGLASEAALADEPWIWISEHEAPIKVPFKTSGYTFYRGTDSELGEPLEAFLKLVAVNGRQRVLLPRTTSLRGYVTLTNDNDALAFVRLFTDLDTHYLFDDSPGVEIRHVAKMPERLQYATMTTKRFRDRGLFEPRVRKTAKGSFVIERFLLTFERKIVQTEETVEADGRYASKVVKTMSEEEELVFPMYM
jgi:hypothetical protein